MLDLKSCPFCGGKATFAKTTKGWKVECEGRWGTCTINARTHYQPTKGQAVAVKPLEWVDADEGMCTKWRAAALGGHYELVDFGKDDPGFAVNFHWGRPLSFWFIQGEPDERGPTGPKIFPTLKAAKAAAQADYERRILSALSQPHPADERVVEVAAQYAERLANVLWEKHYRNAAPNWKPLTGDLIGIITQIDNMTSGLALATKPAVKDDETVITDAMVKAALAFAGMRTTYENREGMRAALTAKDGRS